MVNCDVDTSETCWCKVATKGILTHSISAVLLLSTHQSIDWIQLFIHWTMSLDSIPQSRPMDEILTLHSIFIFLNNYEHNSR